jgi:hypothetical protein
MPFYTLQNFLVFLNDQDLNFQNLDTFLEEGRNSLMESRVLNKTLIELVHNLIQLQERGLSKKR